MPKIFKAYDVNIDLNNRVNIDVLDRELINRNAQAREQAEMERQLSQEEAAQAHARHIIEDAERQAREIIDDASTRAQDIYDEMRRQAEKLAEKIKQDSRDQGHEEGYLYGLSQADAAKQEAEEYRENTFAECDTILAGLEGQIVELIISIVGKLLTDTVKLNRDVVVNLIKQGLEGATLTGEIKIYLSSVDMDTVLEHKNEILAMADNTAKIEFVKDPNLKPNDCIIETPFGNIDSSLDQQFNSIKQDLYYIFENR